MTKEAHLGLVTTCHGIPDVFRSQNQCMRLTWVVLIAFAFIYMISQIIMELESTAQGVWESSVFKRPQPEGLVYPTLVLCNYNRISKYRATAADLNDMLIGYLFAAIPNTYSVYERFDNPDVDKEFLTWSHKYNFTTYEDVMMAFSFNCDETILSASFNSQLQKTLCGEQIDSVEPLGLSRRVNKEMGTCFYISVNETYKQQKAGSHRGISLLLNTNSRDYIELLDNNFAEQGFMFQLNYGSFTSRGQWAALSPGHHYYVGMNMNSFHTRRDWLEFVPPSCITEPTTKVVLSSHYSMDMCEYDCELQAQQEHCGCMVLRPKRYKPLANTTVCHLETWMRCKREKNILLDDFDKNCTNSFDVDDLIVIDFYYESLDVPTTVAYQRVTFSGLLSNIGGLMGLWAGCSLLTIFQAVVYLFSFLQRQVAQLGGSKKQPTVMNNEEIHRTTINTLSMQQYSSNGMYLDV